MEVEVLGVFPSWEEATYQPETIFQTVSLSQSEMVFLNSWFVQLGEASSLLAWMEWPVLSWKNTADVLETQHAINGHLSWITHSKMSARLRAATFFSSFQSCERGEAGSLLSPCSYTRMHHSWAGNNIHTLKMMPGVKGRHSRLWKDDYTFKSLFSGEIRVILIRQSCVTVCPGPSM